jgi:hypothetical protein
MTNNNELPHALGRVYIPDDRDNSFPMSTILKDVKKRTHRYWWPSGWWGDQGYTPQCVAYSWLHWVEDGPITHDYAAPPVINPTTLYKECQKVDEWPGENYDGTSVRAGAKRLQAHKLISSYYWAWNVDTVVDALLTTGPVVVGTWWHYNMFFPDSAGLIKLGGGKAGGHAYLLNGVNTKTGLIRIKNSWGRQWGKGGHAYISIDEMDTLIRDQGEACLATEVITRI